MNDGPQPYRMLVIANETCPCPALLDHVADRVGGHDEHAVQIVAPALNSRLRHYLSDSDGAAAAAQERLEVALEQLRSNGITAEGTVGDADPFVAVTDALHAFAADRDPALHPPRRPLALARARPRGARPRGGRRPGRAPRLSVRRGARLAGAAAAAYLAAGDVLPRAAAG